MRIKFLLIFAVFTAIIISCEYDQEEPELAVAPVPTDTSGTNPVDTTTNGGTPVSFCDTAGATYNGQIKAIINLECAKSGCHSVGFGSGDFTTYAGIKAVVNNGKFENRVIKAGGGMPVGGYSSNTSKAYLECWFTKGAPEN